MFEKVINISGKDVKFKSSATIPRLYRFKFKRDIFKDLTKMEKAYSKKAKNDDELQINDLEIFENVAYIMAFHADPSIPKTIDEWLDQFEMFSIVPSALHRSRNPGIRARPTNRGAGSGYLDGEEQ